MDDELVKWGNLVESRVQAENSQMVRPGLTARIAAGLLLPLIGLTYGLAILGAGLVALTWSVEWLNHHW